MPDKETFEIMLTGGHPNSLGRTVEVVELILKDKSKLEELYDCYFSDDEVVRLRTSNAFKRIWRAHPEWLVPYLDGFIDKISKIDQASTQWTLAQLFLELTDKLDKDQRNKAIAIMKRNISESDDWIVQNQTLQTLGEWAKEDVVLKEWFRPVLEKFAKSPRKSVATKAKKIQQGLE